MRSKLALRLLKEVANKEYELEFNSILDLVNIINKDLERLEELEDNETIVANYTFNLIQENKKLKKAIDVFAKHLQLECGLQESWLQFRNGDDQSDDLEPEEHKLLKEVLGNEI